MAGAVEGKYESSGSRFKSSSNIADANTVHIEYSLKAGSYCFKVAYNNTANIPVNTNGMLVHTQRADYNNVSTTNIVKQVYNSHSATFIRHGRGDGENIVFSNWQRIDNFGYNTLAELASGIEPLLPVKGISLSLTLEAGSKIDTEMSKNGIYYIYSTTFGKSAMFTMGATKLGSDSAFLSSSDVNPFTYDLDGNNLIGINREASYGNIFIKNNRTTSVDIRLLYMSYY